MPRPLSSCRPGQRTHPPGSAWQGGVFPFRHATSKRRNTPSSFALRVAYLPSNCASVCPWLPRNGALF